MIDRIEFSNEKMAECILYSNKKARIINLNRIGFQVGRSVVQLAARVEVETVVVPGTDNFAEVVDASLAQRLAVVRARVLDGAKHTLVQHQANAMLTNHNTLRPVGLDAGESRRFICKYFYPLHHMPFDPAGVLFILIASQITENQ